ncbi:MAG: hypothetical protein WEE51_10450 [Pirellulaceae bacterium]
MSIGVSFSKQGPDGIGHQLGVIYDYRITPVYVDINIPIKVYPLEAGPTTIFAVLLRQLAKSSRRNIV